MRTKKIRNADGIEMTVQVDGSDDVTVDALAPEAEKAAKPANKARAVANKSA